MQGYVYVDGKLAGEGSFVSDVSPGSHTLEVRREGFVSYAKTVTLTQGQTYAETVALQRPAVYGSTAVAAERPFEGIYGGFGALFLTGLGGLGSDLETQCSTLGASSCDTPSPIGSGAFGYVGYTWFPVGFELMLGAMFDTASQHANYNGQPMANENPLVGQPARDEKFTFLRVGGIGALRARATIQTRVIRASFAAGLGLAVKNLWMKRSTTATDGSGATSTSVPDPISYVSPGISIDASVGARLGEATSLVLGLMLWAENAGSSKETAPEPSAHLSSGQPLATPGYHLATGSQVFFGPYLGMMFGP
jgi:hypothetical protein